MYSNGRLKKYLEDLAARKPAPGGGSAAALVAAAGAALISMVANYTSGNRKYKDVEENARDILNRSEDIRGELTSLIDGDVEAYHNLSKGLKELKNNKMALQDLYKEALEPPLEVSKLAADGLRLCSKLADIGNKNLITDTAIACLFLESAFLAARYNVYINLKYIEDISFVENIHKILQPLEEEVAKLKEEIIEKCEDVISK